MAKRTGVPTLQGLAHKMCRALAKFQSLIFNLYPDNTALQAALVAASAACSALEAELEAVREYGD